MKGNSDNMNRVLKSYLKLPYMSIPSDISECLVVDLINNSDNYTDDELKQIIKSFCYVKLSKYYKDFDVQIYPVEILDTKSKLKGVQGLLINKTVYLEENLVLDIRNNNLEILRVIMHEVQHIKQRYLIETNDISYRAYLLIMEQIVIMEMNDDYYKDNYYYFFEEIDARLEAEFELYDFLEKNNTELLADNIDEILENVTECEEETQEVFRKVKNKNINREDLFDKIIMKNPMYVEYYPILNFYYNTDGTKIPISKLIERRNSIPSNPSDEVFYNKVKQLDKHIMDNRSGSKLNIKKDIYSLLDYVPSNDNDLVIVEKTLQGLLNNIDNNYDSSLINDIYDSLIDKVDYFKNKVNETKNVANLYTIKLYIMMENASYRKRDKNDTTY